MNKKTIKKILKLNTDFYNEIATDFSDTRQKPWKGWTRVLEEIKKHFTKKKVSVLDIGCGNGRFYKYLETELSHFSLDYFGVDNNKKLLQIAKKRCSNGNFLKLDIFKNLSAINDEFDIVVAFGITHHIPSREFRKKWFSKVANLVKKNGLLIFTFWNFLGTKEKLNKSVNNIKKHELENGDYFLGWRNKKNIFRYCHNYSKNESNGIKKNLDKQGLKLEKSFKSDGKNRELNSYFVFAKK